MKYTTVKNSLNLFGVVPSYPSESQVEAKDNITLPEYGIVIAPGAVWLKNQIMKYLRENKLSGSDLNKSFHKSWNKIWNSSELELLAHQVLHYLSTYGLQAFGLDSPDLIYIPNEELNLPEQVTFKVIRDVPQEEIIARCLKLLESGTALKSETIYSIFDLLEGLGYAWTGDEVIKNREALVVRADRLGILPKDGDNLFRYLFYKATGETLIVKNKKTYEALKKSAYKIPVLSQDQIIELAKSYNRRKPLWVKGFKRALNSNRPIVNKIARYSKAYHKPMKPSVLATLTSTIYSPAQVRQSAEKASIMQIAKAVNALRIYTSEVESRYYKIRNGKGFSNIKPASIPKDQMKIYEMELMRVLRSRVKETKVYCPKGIDYALPVSEKQFSSNVPKGTCIEILPGDPSLLVGVYWEGYRSDLDLSAVSSTIKVGWNTSYSKGGFTRSGDVTSASNGATEWLYANPKEIRNLFLVTLNDYRRRHEVGSPYKIMVATSEDTTIVTRNEIPKYICDPNKLVFELDTTLPQTQTLVGLVIPNPPKDSSRDNSNGIKFYLVDQGMPGGCVSSYSPSSRIIQESLFVSYATQLRLSDLITVETDPDKKEECDVDLSPDNLAKDTIINLFV